MTDKYLNISMDNIRGTCDLKCSFSYNFNEINGLDMMKKASFLDIQLSIDIDYNYSKPDIMFNNEDFFTGYIQINAYPFFYYNNSPVDAELYITSLSKDEKKSVIIVIPLIISKDTSEASKILNYLIDYANNKKTVNNLNLNNIVPKKDFYYLNREHSSNYIIYDRKYFIGLDNNLFEYLKQKIKYSKNKEFYFSFLNYPLFYNSRGPNRLSANESEIYIDCKPVDKNEEEVQIIKDKNFEFSSPKMDFSISPERKFQMLIIFLVFFYFILFAIIIIVLLFVFNYVLKSFMKVKVNKK